jgi:RimJ/RimL family protein N-acetyltransferase
VTLDGSYATLEPLNDHHAADLFCAAADDRIWAFMDQAAPSSLEQVHALIADARREYELGERLPFAIIDKAGNRAVGSTSYIDIRPQDRGLEIGWMWTSPSVWGTGASPEAAYLLLRHAFEVQGVIRAVLKTDARNIRSQRAIEAIGAVREGVWRNHRVLRTGKYRDTVYYSIIDSEWPATRGLIEERLSRYAFQDSAPGAPRPAAG